MDTVINAVGGGINALIIAALAAYAFIGCVIASIGTWLFQLYQKKKKTVEGIEGSSGKSKGLYDGVFHPCPEGADARVVEGTFHDIECTQPCNDKTCQLAS